MVLLMTLDIQLLELLEEVSREPIAPQGGRTPGPTCYDSQDSHFSVHIQPFETFKVGAYFCNNFYITAQNDSEDDYLNVSACKAQQIGSITLILDLSQRFLALGAVSSCSIRLPSI